MHCIPADQLARRRPVWEAMSDFFLDTELDDARLGEIAAILRVSGYTISELEDILATEVAPLLYKNVLAPAGAWSSFDTGWIEGQIAGGRHRDIALWHRFAARWSCRRVIRGVRAQYWTPVLRHLRGSVG